MQLDQWKSLCEQRQGEIGRLQAQMAAQMVQLNLAVELAEDQLKHKEAEATNGSSTQQQSVELLLAEQRKYSLLNQEFEVRVFLSFSLP